MGDEARGLRTMVGEAMREWQVPGVALAVVRGSGVVFAEGFGARSAAGGGAVTEHTVFPIGSCTKAFTTAAIAGLVDDGALAWDAPVREYLPAFALCDPFASERATLRDLVLHRTGLPPHAFAWYGVGLPVDAMLERLPHLALSADFRSAYQYNNLAFAIAGLAAGRVAGSGWEELVRQRLFSPLSLGRAFTSVEQAEHAGDVAQPHVRAQGGGGAHEVGQVRQIPFPRCESVAPAGAVSASAADMAAWLLVHLGAYGPGRLGSPGSPRPAGIISEWPLRELHRPQAVTPDPAFPPALSHVCAGLGWNVVVFRGELMVRHGGEFDGFRALASFMPHRGLGVVCLSNLHGTLLPYAVTYGAYERLLGLTHTPWEEVLRGGREPRAAAAGLPAGAPADRPPVHEPIRDPQAYAGEYRHPGHGTLVVEAAEGAEGDGGPTPRLRTELGRLTAALAPRGVDTFDFSFAWPTGGATRRGVFQREASGRVASLTVALEPLVPPVRFARGPRSA